MIKTIFRLPPVPWILQLRPSSTIPWPELDWDWLLNENNADEIRNNVNLRKGVGDVNKLMQLTAKMKQGDEVLEELIREGLTIPNLTHPDVPVGDDENAKTVALHNEIPKFDFIPKNATEIGSHLKGLRTENVGITTGKKSYYVMNDVAMLERALIKYTIDKLKKSNFQFISVPDILDASVIQGCGFQTHGLHNMVYKVSLPLTSYENTREFCLSGTAEMGISAYLKNRVVSESDLPLKLASLSRCYRAEVATRVIDKGLYRVLQFSKVEMFVLTKKSVDISEEMLKELVDLQVELFQPLGFCFRVLEMPSEELGAPAYHKFDIESWIPSRNRFSEISSTSNCTDFQARRLSFKYLDGNEKLHCHTLNGTACALPRLIQTILENNQCENGEVVVPDVLVPFCRHTKRLTPPPDWPVFVYSNLKS